MGTSVDGFPLQEVLSYDEEIKRRKVLSDWVTPSTPLITSPRDNALIKENWTISFEAFDEHLSAVLLLINNKVQDGTYLEWNYIDGRKVFGAYKWNIQNVDAGNHSLLILAFDEHGAFNSPSAQSITVLVAQNGNVQDDNNNPVLVTAVIIALIVVVFLIYIKYRQSLLKANNLKPHLVK